jgi:hypothetical protein
VQDRHETAGRFSANGAEIAAASGGWPGGSRAGGAACSSFRACHAPAPNQLALSFAEHAYDDMDHLKHPADIEALQALVRQLIDVSQRMM